MWIDLEMFWFCPKRLRSSLYRSGKGGGVALCMDGAPAFKVVDNMPLVMDEIMDEIIVLQLN